MRSQWPQCLSSALGHPRMGIIELSANFECIALSLTLKRGDSSRQSQIRVNLDQTC
jgi:hypothetical protein